MNTNQSAGLTSATENRTYRGASNDIVSVRFDKPHYASVNKSDITDICIEVKDDQNKHVRFTYGKVGLNSTLDL